MLKIRICKIPTSQKSISTEPFGVIKSENKFLERTRNSITPTRCQNSIFTHRNTQHRKDLNIDNRENGSRSTAIYTYIYSRRISGETSADIKGLCQGCFCKGRGAEEGSTGRATFLAMTSFVFCPPHFGPCPLAAPRLSPRSRRHLYQERGKKLDSVAGYAKMPKLTSHFINRRFGFFSR